MVSFGLPGSDPILGSNAATSSVRCLYVFSTSANPPLPPRRAISFARGAPVDSIHPMGIGTLLMDRGLISREQLEDALSQQQASGERLDRILVRMGLVDSERVLHVVGDQFHMPVIDLASVEVKPEVLQILPAKLVYRQNCVPISRENGTLRVATSDPFELPGLDELRLLTGCSIEVVLADDDELRNFIRAHYGVGSDTLDEMSAGLAAKGDRPRRGGGRAAQEASVIKLSTTCWPVPSRRRDRCAHRAHEPRTDCPLPIDGVPSGRTPPTINRFAARSSPARRSWRA